VESALEGANFPTPGELLTVTSGLLEYAKKEGSFFHPYFQTLPRNISGLGLYWTKEERMCVVDERDGSNAETLRDFRTAFDALRRQFTPLSKIEDKTA